MSQETRLSENIVKNESDHTIQCGMDKNTEAKSKRWFQKIIEQTWAFRSKITVEPFIVCYILPSVLIGMTVQNLGFHKACLVDRGYDNQTCYDIMNGQKNLHKEEEFNAQQTVTKMTAWSHPLQSATPGILVVFLGAWSDRTGNRKSLMISPIMGKLVSTAGLILSTVFFMNVDVTMTALIEGLPPALTGGRLAMTMAVYSYVADITTESERTFRLGIVTAAMTLSRPLGLALSGYMTNRAGYIFVFSFAFVFFLVGFLYVVLKLDTNPKKVCPDTSQKLEPSSTKPFYVLIINDLLSTLNVAFKKRKQSHRLQIFLVMIAYMLIVGPVLGESQLSYWFARHKFNFNEIDNSVLLTFSFIMGSIGSCITIYVFLKRWQLDDFSIAMIACVSRISASIVYAVAPTTRWFFLGPALDMFSSAGATSLRSAATKLVGSGETGKIISVLSISEALVTVIYTPSYSAVYYKTLDGSFYFISSGLAFIAVIVLFQTRYLRIKETQEKNIEASMDTVHL